MALTFILLLLSLLLLIKSADFAIRYAARLAESFHLSKYVVGFIVVAIISVLPETFISITSAVAGLPVFGLSTLFGSNVADLTLVFALVVFISGRSLKVESKIINNRFLHLLVISLVLFFGWDGHFSRWEGIALIALGLGFYIYILKKHGYDAEAVATKFSFRNLLLLLTSMAALLAASQLTVKYGVELATNLHVNPALIGMFIVGLGTTLPELSFALRAAKHHHDGLALGDILGAVIADATVVVGIIAVIRPFQFDPKLVYITGLFMVLAMYLLFYFMKSGRVLTKKEAFLLLLFYTAFILTEMFAMGG